MSRLMNPLTAFSFVVLCGSIALIAETPGTPIPSSNQISVQPQTYVVPAPAMAECPVSMRAQHGSGGALMMARNPKSGLYAQPNQDGRSGGLEQRIHLILGKVKDSARVVAAKVTVRGMNGKWLAMPASSLQYGTSNAGTLSAGSSNIGSAVKTIDVRFGITADQTEFADLVLPGFSSVQSITLNSLTYADGSTWSSFNGNACRVAPEPFMLVSAN